MKRLSTYKHLIILFFIVVVASCLRLYKLGSVPGSLYIDEVAIGVDARSIMETGKDMHGGSWLTTVFPSYGDFKLPVYIWLASLSMRLFGETDFAVRFPSAFAGILTVVMVYMVTLELFKNDSKKITYALSSAFIVAIMPWSIHFSRTGFEAHVGQLLLLLALWCGLKGREQLWYYAFSACVGAAAVYTYYSVRFVFPPLLISAIVLFMPKIKRVKLVGILIGIIALFLLVLYPMSTSPWYAQMQYIRLSTRNVLDIAENVDQSNTLRSISNNDFLSRFLYHRYAIMGRNLFQHYLDYINPQFLFLTGDSNLRHGTREVGILLFATFPLLCIGLYTVIKKYPRVGILLCVWFVFGILPAAVPYDTPHALRSLNVLGMYAILLGFGFGELITVSSLWQRLFALFLILCICVNLLTYLHDYYVHYPKRSEGTWWAMSKKTVAQFVKENKSRFLEVDIQANDKMFLWIAWYSSIPVKTIQEASEASFVKLSLGNIVFHTTLHVEKNKKDTLYISESSQLQDNPFSRLISDDESEPFRYVETQ